MKESIYSEVSHIIKTFPGLKFRSSKIDHIIKKLTWKQFEKYQSISARMEFMSQQEFESITKSKSMLKEWLLIVESAKKFYMENDKEAQLEIKAERLQEEFKEELNQEEIQECGFDLSEVNIVELQALFQKYSISKSCIRDEKKYAYIFSSYLIDSIEIRMGAHPFANGLLFNTSNGMRGEGYCSYVGIKGPASFVNDFKRVMRKYGNSKEYSDTPDYI